MIGSVTYWPISLLLIELPQTKENFVIDCVVFMCDE